MENDCRTNCFTACDKIAYPDFRAFRIADKITKGRFFDLVYAKAHTNHHLHIIAIANNRGTNSVFADLLG